MKILQLYLAASLLCSLAVAKVLTATGGYDYCKEYRNVKGVECNGPEPIRVKYNIAKGRISTGGYCDIESPDTVYIYFHDKDSLVIKSTTEYSCEDRYGSYLALPEETVKDAKYMEVSVSYSSTRSNYVKCRDEGKHLFITHKDSKDHVVKNNRITCEKPEVYYKKRNNVFIEEDECGQRWFFISEEGRKLQLPRGVQRNPDCPDLGEREFE